MEALGPSAGVAGGSATVVLGVNLDDLGDHRPGQAAAAERGAVFPLVDGRLHQGRCPGLVPAARSADVGQAGRCLPGLPRARTVRG